MTQLSRRKTRLTFETDTLVRRRAIIVEPEPLICVVRLKGTRQRLALSWESVYVRAAEIAAEQLRAARKAARAKKKR